jgi:deoxycytidylate deaminase
LSDHIRHKVGAALFKKKSLISIGWNTQKSHPDSKTLLSMQHAEFNCLVGNHKYDLVGSTIFVARITRHGILGISKPCDDCEEFLRLAGVKAAWYIDRGGAPAKMRF